MVDTFRSTRYCRRCGLQYRKWNIQTEFQACEECEPDKYRKIYNTNVTQIKKRTVGQDHITEHTFFPKKTYVRQYNINWKKTPDNKRENK